MRPTEASEVQLNRADPLAFEHCLLYILTARFL